MRRLLPLLALPPLAACGPHAESLGKTRDAPPTLTVTSQVIGPGGELRGTAALAQNAQGTSVTVNVSGLPPGSYGIHLHATGKCEGPGFTTAGGHFNPAMKQHGRDNPQGSHAGDLPNVVVGADGKGRIDYEIPGLRLASGTEPLLDADGAAIVLHAGPDDYRTDPAGNSGARIACGVLAAR